MNFFKKIFQGLSTGDKRMESQTSPVSGSAQNTENVDQIVKTVRRTACIVLGFDPEDKDAGIDVNTSLQSYCFGAFQIDLVEIINEVEASYGIYIDDNDWITSSTPNWEYCTVTSIAEIVERKLKEEPQSKSSLKFDDAGLGRAPSSSTPVADQLYLSGLQQYGAGNYAAAEEVLDMALILDQDGLRNLNANRSALIANFARLYQNIGLFAHVNPPELQEQRYHRILHFCEASQAIDSTMVEALSAFGRVEWGAKRLDQAQRLFEKATASARSLFGQQDPRIEPCLFWQGKLALALRNIPKAKTIFQEVYLLLTAKHGSHHPEVAKALEQQAMAYKQEGEYDLAATVLQQATLIWRQVAPRSRELAICAHQLATVLFYRRDFKGAQQLLLSAIGIMTDLLVPQKRRDELRNPESPWDDTEKIQNEAGRKDPVVLEMLANLAVAFHETGPPGFTMTKYEQALGLYEEIYGKEDVKTGRLLISVGSFYSELGQHSKALQLLERSLTILERNLQPDDPELAPILHNLAGCYRQIGGHQTEAIALLERCIRIREKANGPMHQALAMPLRQLAYSWAEQQDRGRAFALLSRAVQIEQDHFAKGLIQGTEKEKFHLAAHLEARTNATLAFHAKYTSGYAPAYRLMVEATVNAKASVLDAVSGSLVKLRFRGEEKDMRLIQRWTTLISKEAGWYVSKMGDRDWAEQSTPWRDPEFDDIRVERERVEHEIALRVAETGGDVFSPVSITALQSALPAEAVLIEYCKIDPVDFTSLQLIGDADNEVARYTAFVLHKTGEPAWLDLGIANAIDAKIAELREAWNNEEAVWRNVAREVDASLFEPLCEFLPPAVHVILVPASQLCFVPFAALVNQQGEYEIQQYTFTYLTTSRDLVRTKRTGKEVSPPLIMAGPDFERVNVPKESLLPADQQFRSFNFDELPQAKAEGMALQSLLPHSILKTGSFASKSALEEARAPSLLHLATHGFYLPNNWSDLDRVMYEFSGAALSSPLLRSGIALAGANHYKNGLLTALEIAGLDLHGTQLVALSACETGLGDESSWEGVFGFRRSFFLAGTESLLVSLFPVPDEATKKVMELFYQQLLSGSGRSQALREAQLSMLKAGEAAHPMNWAAFVMIGKHEPIKFYNG